MASSARGNFLEPGLAELGLRTAADSFDLFGSAGAGSAFSGASDLVALLAFCSSEDFARVGSSVVLFFVSVGSGATLSVGLAFFDLVVCFL